MTYTIEKDILDQIHDEMANWMDDLGEVITDYSGRGMWNQTCVAWTHDAGSIRFGLGLFMAILQVSKDNKTSENKILQLARQEDWWELFSVISQAREDALGQRTVTYYPSITVEP